MTLERAIPLTARLADLGVAALEAVWPRSTAAREVDRLARDGYATGALYDVDFSVSFDEEFAEQAIAAIRDAGFTIVERVGSARVFVIVRSRLPLRAFHLSRSVALLDRLVAPYYGYATLLAPAARVDGESPTANPVREGHLSSGAA